MNKEKNNNVIGSPSDSVYPFKGSTPITCDFISFDSFLKKVKNPDLIKLDIEGSEYIILKKSKLIFNAKQLLIEFHDSLKPDNLDYIKLVEEKGFTLKKKTMVADQLYVCHFVKE